MKAQDLRIGNKILFSPTGRVKIKPRVVTVLELSSKHCVVEDMGLPVKLFYISPDTQPIPLTEEWLLKFGFTFNKESENWEKLGCNYCIYEDNKKYHFSMHFPEYNEPGEQETPANTVIVVNNILNVHQLQNLYFALTGEELKIKTK